MTMHATTTKTPLPPGIESPDEVQTRLGTLRFFDGFPDDATVRTLFDNLDFQRAVQAYQLALPAVVMATQRRGLSTWGPANSTMVIWEDLVYPRYVGYGFNNSTACADLWIDLHDGPTVVEAPPGILGFINNAWGRWVVDVGLSGPDKGQGGMYLFLPPGYDGDVPDGYFVLRPPTYGLFSFWRSFPDEHGDPHPGVEVIKAETRVYRLGQADDTPPMHFVNVSPEPWVTVAPGDYQLWELLNEVVQCEAPQSSDPLTLGMFASIGIEHGKPFEPDDRMRAILTEAAAVGDATNRALAYRFRQPEAYYYPDSAWRTAYLGGYQLQEDGVALLDSAAQLFFVGWGLSPVMGMEVVGAGSQYVVAFVDADDAPLDGGKTYRLHVPPDVPINNFWSVIAHDTQTRSMLQTGQVWPAVASNDKDLTTNDDGSVDVYFAPEPPAEDGNWVQTLPNKGWYAGVRLYGPLEPWFEKTWRLPDIERLI